MFRWSIAVDLVLAGAAAYLGYMQALQSPIGVAPVAVASFVACAAGLALLVRRRYPFVAFAVASAAMVLNGMLVPALLVVFTLAWRNGNRRSTWIGVVVTIVLVLVPWGGPMTAPTGLVVVVAFCLAVTPALFGLWLAQRRELFDSLRERAEQAERERDLRAATAVTQERAHIARELHDVVAHRISQITVQAGALEVTSDGVAATSAAAIRTTAAAALAEMREMLGVLRADGEAPLHPAPSLDGVRDLMDGAIAHGERLRVSLPDTMPQVPGAVGRAVYRLIQESLTNAAKHAAGAEIWVRVAVSDTALTVLVRNDPGASRADSGGGLGLIGMRERVEQAGGALTTAAEPGGGFRVAATFELEREAA
ncbi:sensor histidine kinase [Nocardia sp. NPDC052566]|uniref:sensor histidine kinase n=1 Tax=Nocardia sp. NPDC052566 TaxID=3364330 RepID=UPI0037C943BE